MKSQLPFTITREKHLDHMVRVVPLLFFGYVIQVFFLSKMQTALGMASLVFLGVSLASMIGLFVIYDLKHQVTLFEDRLEINFFGFKKSIRYSEIDEIKASTPDESFSTILIRHERKKTRIYFVDSSDEVIALVKPTNEDRRDSAA